MRNWRLFLAILTGVLITATLFASANVGANATMNALLQEYLEQVPVDMIYYPNNYDRFGFPNSTNLIQYQQFLDSVPGVTNTELLARHSWYNWTRDESKQIIGIESSSVVYQGLTVIDGVTSLGVNETYILQRSANHVDFPIGSNFSIQIQAEGAYTGSRFYNITIEVVGIVELTDEAFGKLLGYIPYWGGFYDESYFIVDFNDTFLPIIDQIGNMGGVNWFDLDPRFFIFIDRVGIINPYDVISSVEQINRIEEQIRNYLGWNINLNNQLSGILIGFSSIAEMQRMSFLMVSVPVFFIALYMGITLNDVSFSLRRREVGLLLTKGLTRGQITSLFVMESVLVGTVASLAGLGLSILIVPFFIGTGTYVPVHLSAISLDTLFLTLIFGIGLAMVTTYFPARKAVQIPTAEALREYTLTGETMSYNRLLVWSCFILGTYKIIIWTVGFNVLEFLYDIPFTNPILYLIVSIWGVMDTFLNFWGPLFFFYGFTTILVKGSERFHDYSSRFIRRILGDLGGIAAHTIRRRPGRTAAVIFISALLIGYSIQTIGILSTNEDLTVRSIYKDVGADLRINVQFIDNATNMLPVIRNIEGVKGATNEFEFSLQTTDRFRYIRAINVSEWVEVAYYEIGWFPLYPAHLALDALSQDNQTIILERKVATRLSLNIGDEFSMLIPALARTERFTLVGFFGPEPEYDPSPWAWETWLAEDTWSYISIEKYQEIGWSFSSTGTILVSLDSPAANDAIVEELEGLEGVTRVDSAITRINEIRTNLFVNSQGNMLRMGILFAFLLTSLGTIIVVYLTLRERRTSTALMSARGLTYGQTVLTLVAESLTMMVFAVLVGSIVGFIVYYGLTNVSTGISIFLGPTLVNPVFLPPSFLGPITLQISAFIGMLLLATVIPILIEAKLARYDLSVLR
jgi:ABC-type lipoprotein release transport system permease subunit